MSLKNSILSKSNQFNHYKSEAEKLKKENESLKKENKQMNNKINVNKNDLISQERFSKGISVIIPTYNGENHIKGLLESIENQSLSPEQYELIFIINGSLYPTIEILNEFMEKNPEINVEIHFTKVSGAGNARNIGIDLVKREFTTFVDDDDFLSPNYLEKLLEHSKENRIVMSNFIDIDEESHEEMESYVLPFSNKTHGIIKEAPVKFANLASIITAKAIPSPAIKSTKFNTELENGEDISYYGRLYSKFDFEFYVIDRNEEAIYYRLKRSSSVSRQELSYEFNILGRLKVIEDLNSSLEYTENEKIQKYIKICCGGQTGLMRKYLNEYPEDKEKVLKEIEKHDFKYFPYNKLEK